MAERHKNWKKDSSKSEDEKLDNALEDSFPASDPPAATDPSHVGRKDKPSEAPRRRS